MRPLVLPALPLLLLAAACTPPAQEAANDAAPAAAAPRPGASPPAGQAAPASAPAARPVSIADKSALLDFSYDWPAEAAAIPKLDARLRADARTARQRALNAARQDQAARGSDFPFHAHEMTKKWTVEGDAAGLLALRDEFYAFTGGAHGMSGFEFILWDRAADRDIAVMDLFADKAKARAELTRLFCPTLDTMRAERRGEAVRPDSMFGDCPKLDDQVLIPSDTRAGAFTSIRVLIGPYEAGPYAEGSYDVRLNVTPALVALLKPERRGVLVAR